MNRFIHVLLLLAASFLPASAAAPKQGVVIGMSLEPPGLDPTSGAAAAIGEIVLGNIFEGLTRINADASVSPLAAQSWTVSPDGRTYTFKLRAGLSFQDGEPLSSTDAKFSFERAAASDSTNKDKAFFATLEKIEAVDAQTLVLTFKEPNPDALFHLGLPTAVVVSPKSAATNAAKPVGSGPFRLENWIRGTSLSLARWDAYKGAAKPALTTATFRFINDPSAQVAALLAGDVDAFPRFGGYQSVAKFAKDPRFVVTQGGTEGKTILSLNNKRKPFDDVRVRRAIAAALDRKAIIDGAMNGFGTPIGSHAVPIDPGYVDLTGLSPYDPAKARALLAEAGIALPLNVTLTLPPPAYARQSGEIVAAQLADIGINAKIENVEWAQWLSGTLKDKNFDMTIISHVEPMDIAIYANPSYYFQYDSAPFRELLARMNASQDKAERLKLFGDAQKMLAQDAVNGFLFQLPQVTIADARLKGLWKDSPVFANDLSALRWE